MNRLPKPLARPSYHDFVSCTSAEASGLKTTVSATQPRSLRRSDFHGTADSGWAR